MLDADKLSPASPEDLAAACVLPWASRSIEILSPDGHSRGVQRMFGLCRSTPKEVQLWLRPARGNEKPASVIQTAESKSARRDALSLSLSRLRENPRRLHRAQISARPTVFSSANERQFPPRAPGSAKCLAYPCAPNPRRRQSDPNDMSKIRSRRSEDNSRSRSPAPSCAARVAKLCHHDDPIRDHRDTVELSGRPGRSTMAAKSFRAASPISVSLREAMRSNV